MGNKDKKAIRADFRASVFNRDGYTCKICYSAGKDRQGGDSWKKFHKHRSENSLVNLDSHHIIKREWMPNGGYVKENGITVCDDCHMKAEAFWIALKTGNGECPPGFLPCNLFQLIGSDADKAIEASRELGGDDD